jgi:hypothetical protein
MRYSARTFVMSATHVTCLSCWMWPQYEPSKVLLSDLSMSELTSTHTRTHARTHAHARTTPLCSLMCTPVNSTCIPSQCPCNATTGATGMACSSDCRPGYLCKLRDIAAVRACPVSCASARRRQRQGGQHTQRCVAGDVHRGGLCVRCSRGGYVHHMISHLAPTHPPTHPPPIHHPTFATTTHFHSPLTARHTPPHIYHHTPPHVTNYHRPSSLRDDRAMTYCTSLCKRERERERERERGGGGLLQVTGFSRL